MTIKENSTVITLKNENVSCTIFHADSRDIVSKYPDIFDLIITSPPYADAREKHYDSVKPDNYKDWFLTFHEPLYQSLKSKGNFLLNIKDRVVKGVRHRYVWETIMALSDMGWKCIDDYIWNKPNPMPGYWPTRFMDGWEYCFHLAKQTKPYFDREAVKRPIGDWVDTRLQNLSNNDKERHNSSNQSGFGRDLSYWVDKKKVFPPNVLTLPLVGKNKGHPAVYPTGLPEFFIKLLSPKNGHIVDPFSGSGTTGIAALSLHRNCVLIENNEEYYEISIKRIISEVKGAKIKTQIY